MAVSTSLPLSLLVNVNVTVAPTAQTAPALNQGLIVGPSTIIPSVGANSRLRFYTTLAQAALDGFSTANPEYVALGMYLSQTPTPIGCWVGRQDLTADTVSIVDTAAEGTGYKVGDILTLVGSGATVQVSAITSPGGAVTGITLLTGGTGATVATGIATTGGTGTGAEVNITAIGESFLQAVTACQLASTAWYGFMCVNAIKADHQALSAYADASSGSCFYFYSTSDADASQGLATSIFALNKALLYTNDLGIYSTTQAGLFPNNAYTAAAVMGAAMGNNTGLAGSYFNLMFVPITGVAPEPFNQAGQLTNITSVNGNVVVDIGPYQVLGGKALTPSGRYFDETLFLNSMAFDFQYAIANVFIGQTIPLNNIGQQVIISAAKAICAKYASIGFVAAGVWNGGALLALTQGQSLPLGYFVQSDTYLNQTAAARAARQGMPVYVALVEAGSMDSISLAVQVQR